MRDILAQGYVPYYGSVSQIPEGTVIVIQRNEEDFTINIFKMRPTYHTPIVESDRAYKVNAVTITNTPSIKYTLYDTNNPDEKLEITLFEITNSTTLGKYSLYIPKETNDEINDAKNKKPDTTVNRYNNAESWKGGGRKPRKQKSKKRSTRKSKTLKKKSRKTRRR
jgi:hypothetical protein